MRCQRCPRVTRKKLHHITNGRSVILRVCDQCAVEIKAGGPVFVKKDTVYKREEP